MASNRERASRAFSGFQFVGLASAAACALVFGTLRAQTTTITAKNLSDLPRIEWVRASVPFARGKFAADKPIPFHVDKRPTEWRVLQRWPDGTVKSAQAQWLDAVDSGRAIQRKLVAGQKRAVPFLLHPAISDSVAEFRLTTSVVDRDGVPYLATARPFETPGSHVEVLHGNNATYSVRTRDYHRNPTNQGIGRDLFSQTCYWTFFSQLPLAVVDVVVANDYLGADKPKSQDPNLYPLGDIGFRSLDLFVRKAEGSVRWPVKNKTGPHLRNTFAKPSLHVQLLREDYLGDAQGKRWRVVLFFDSPKFTDTERLIWRTVAESWRKTSLIPTVDLATWQRTKGFGIYGGPVSGSSWGPIHIRESHEWWQKKDHFGPWGDWGDFTHSWVTGTHRNGPSTEHKILAVQHQDPLPLHILEGKAWQQTARPYQLWNIRIEPDDDIYMWSGLPYTLTSSRRISNETLGRFALKQNDPYKHYRKGVPLGFSHRWNAYDIEHFSTELLFDYYTMTGDWRSLDEMRMLGECYMGLFRHKKYTVAFGPTSPRGEGWPAAAVVKLWFATGEDRFIQHLQRRIRDVIEPKRKKDHPSRAISFARQHPLTKFPTPNTFMLPWQHAAIIYGYLPLWTYWGDKTARKIAHDVLHTIEYSWVFNYRDPRLGLLPDAMRFYTPITYNGKPVAPDIWDSNPNIGLRYGNLPLGGAHTHFVAALDLLAEDTTNAVELSKMSYVRKRLQHDRPNSDRWRYSRWFSLREPK